MLEFTWTLHDGVATVKGLRVDANMIVIIELTRISIDGEDYLDNHDVVSIKVEFTRLGNPPLDTY